MTLYCIWGWWKYTWIKFRFIVKNVVLLIRRNFRENWLRYSLCYFQHLLPVLFIEYLRETTVHKYLNKYKICSLLLEIGRCPWCNGYRLRKWTRRHEFKSWTIQIAFHIALIPLGKVWIQLFSLQLWGNSRTD